MTGRARAHLGVRSIATYVAILSIGFALAAAPAAADSRRASAVTDRAQVEVTGEFDKASYKTGELISIKVQIKNVGSEKAVGLTLATNLLVPTDLKFDLKQLGELGNSNPGATIEPGATLEKTLSGHMGQPDADVVTLTGNIFGQDGFGVAEFRFSAPVTKTVSHVAGIVFGDKDGNGKLDSGEELAGAKLTWRYADSGQFVKEVTSGAGGTFDFGDLPTVRYFTNGQATGWIFPFDVVIIDESDDNTDLRIRAQRPVKDKLHATMEFTKDGYQVGELAHVKVTLSNSGPIPIRDIVFGCNRSDEGPQLHGTGPGWAALDDGVTLAAGETKVLDVSENVPEAARVFGFVLVSCDFGIGEADIDDNAFAGDDAIVQTDLRATFAGEVKSFPDGPTKPGVGLAGVRVVLTAPGDCPVIGDTTTDANGKYKFTNLVPGPDRKIYLVAPQGWRIIGDNPKTEWIVASRDQGDNFTAERGEGTAPEIPTQPASCTTPQPTTPEPQGRSSSGLANTGVSVVGLTALGALALLAGAAAVISTRRRRKTANQ